MSKRNRAQAQSRGEGQNRSLERTAFGRFLARILLFFGRMEESLADGFFGKTVSSAAKRINFGGKVARPVRTAVARELEQSLLLNLLDRFFKLLLQLPLRAYGTFSLTFTIFSTVIALGKEYLQSGSLLSVGVFVWGAAGLLLSAILIFAGRERRLGGWILDSRILSKIVFDLLGIRRKNFETESDVKGGSFAAFVSAAVAAALTILFSPTVLIKAVLWVLFVRTALIRPESGLLCALLFLPVLPARSLVVMVFTAALSYLIKLLRGKRNLRMTAYGITAIALSLLLLIGAANGGESRLPGFSVYAAMLLVFFLSKTMFTEREWIFRISAVLSLSACLTALRGLAVFSADLAARYLFDALKQYRVYFPRVFPAAFGSDETVGIFLALSCVILIVRYMGSEKFYKRFIAVLALLLLIGGAVISRSMVAWAALAAALLVLFILHRNVLVIPIVLILAALITAYKLFVPEFIAAEVRRFAGSFSMVNREASTAAFGDSARRAFIGIGDRGVAAGQNLFAHLLTSAGLVGLLFFLLLTVGTLSYGFFACRRSSRTNGLLRWQVCGYSAAIFSMLTAGCGFDLLSNEKTFFLLMLLLGTVFASGRILIADSERQNRSSELDRDFTFIPVFRRDQAKVEDGETLPDGEGEYPAEEDGEASDDRGDVDFEDGGDDAYGEDESEESDESDESDESEDDEETESEREEPER